MSEFELRRRLRALSSERAPRNDLWPAIAQRIHQEATTAAPTRSARRLAFAAAAGIVIALGAGWIGSALQRDNATSPMTAQSAMTDRFDMPDRAHELSRMAGRDPRLAGAAVVLDSAHSELEQALEQQPDAVFLVGLINRNNEARMRLARLAMKAG